MKKVDQDELKHVNDKTMRNGIDLRVVASSPWTPWAWLSLSPGPLAWPHEVQGRGVEGVRTPGKSRTLRFLQWGTH